jgi:hypothetical protein
MEDDDGEEEKADWKEKGRRVTSFLLGFRSGQEKCGKQKKGKERA